MISPEVIISEGWDSYEENQIDYYYYELSEAGLYPEYYPDEFAKFYYDEIGLEKLLLNSPEAYFDYLEKRGEWFGHFYSCLRDQLDYEYYVEDHCEILTLEEEYEMFCKAEYDTSKFELDKPWYNVQDEIDRCDSINSKRKKHNKDNRRNTWWDQHRHGDRYLENREHGHKRAEKVYTAEESEIYFWYLQYEDLDGDYGMCTEACKGTGNCLYGTCMSCDWSNDMQGLAWYDDDFIEYWDYPEYWHKNIKVVLDYNTEQILVEKILTQDHKDFYVEEILNIN